MFAVGRPLFGRDYTASMTPADWAIKPAPTISPELLDLAGNSHLVASLLAQRGFDTPAKAQPFLDASHYHPSPPSALLGMDAAVGHLARALERGDDILIWGDFDVDGQTSTALLVDAIRTISNSDNVRYHIPNRFDEGHGIDLDVLKEKLSAADFSPSLLLTCDTGIAEGPAIGYAKDHELTVIVTDHHDLTPEFQTLQPQSDPVFGLPPEVVGRDSVRRADAIINPKLQPPGDAQHSLPGVGVAYRLVQELFKRLGRSGAETEYLDLVALGIVADVAEQVLDTRYLLQLGLEQLRATQRTGLLALIKIARLVPSSVDTHAIGYQLSPRLNALGRLGDATVAVELLTTTDAVRAELLAAKMERLNQQRRLLTSQITAATMEILDRNPQFLDFEALVLSHPAWHAGIVGIVAARLAEEFQKPAVLLLTPPGELARGSARSVPGVDIGASIAACAHLLVRHGGHPGAAGLRLLPENIDRFRRELDRQIPQHRIQDDAPGLIIDSVLSLSDLDLPLVDAIQKLAPFGNGNPTPRFMSKQLDIAKDRRIGREGAHRRLALKNNGGDPVPVIWFNGGDLELPRAPIDLAYELNIHEYRGEIELQLTYVDSRSSLSPPVDTPTGARQTYRLHDFRSTMPNVRDLPTPPKAVWYAEGIDLGAGEEEVAYAPRHNIHPDSDSAQLVIWSVPPSPRLLHWLIETVKPTELFLCGRHTVDDSFSSVLRHVAGMGKYALTRGLPLNLNHMAARLGTTEAIIRASLLLLESKGTFELGVWGDDDRVEIRAGSTTGELEKVNADGESRRLRHQTVLAQHLAEVRAYRRFFTRATPRTLGLVV